MQRKIERMPGLAGKKCSMLQGLQAGYTQCFDICCRLLHRLCLLFHCPNFISAALPGREKAADSQRHPDGRIFAAFDRNPCGWILFLLSKGTAWAVKSEVSQERSKIT